mgnify:CR=1 FL=1
MPVNLDWLSQIAQPVKPVDPLQMQMQQIALQNAQLQQQEALQNIQKQKLANDEANQWNDASSALWGLAKKYQDPDTGMIPTQAWSQIMVDAKIPAKFQDKVSGLLRQNNKDVEDYIKARNTSAEATQKVFQTSMQDMANQVLSVPKGPQRNALIAATVGMYKDRGWVPQQYNVFAQFSKPDPNNPNATIVDDDALESWLTVMATPSAEQRANIAEKVATTKKIETEQKDTERLKALGYLAAELPSFKSNPAAYTPRAKELNQKYGMNLPEILPPSTDAILKFGQTPEQQQQTILAYRQLQEENNRTNQMEQDRQLSRLDQNKNRVNSELKSYFQPIETSIDNLERGKGLATSATAASDALLAEAAISELVGGKGTGVRLTKAQLDKVATAQGFIARIKQAIQQGKTGERFSSELRQQLIDLFNEQLGTLKSRRDILAKAYRDVENATDTSSQNKILIDARERMFGMGGSSVSDDVSKALSGGGRE